MENVIDENDTTLSPEVYVKSLQWDSVDDKLLTLKKLQTLQSKVISSIPTECKLEIFENLSVLLDTVNGQPKTLTPLMEGVLNAIISLSCDTFFTDAFKDKDHELLQITALGLTSLSSTFEETELEKLLRCLEVVTKGFRARYKPYLLSDLVKVLLEVLNTRSIESELFIHSIKVLINICGNALCFLEVHNNELLQDVLERLSIFAKAKSTHFRYALLIHHVMAMLDSTFVDDKWLMSNLKFATSCVKEIRLDLENPEEVKSAHVCLEESWSFLKKLFQLVEIRVDQFSRDEKFDPLDYGESQVSEEFLKFQRMIADVTCPTLAYLRVTYEGKILEEYHGTVMYLLMELTPPFILLKYIVSGIKDAFALMKSIVPFEGGPQNSNSLANHRMLEALAHLTKSVVKGPDDSNIRHLFNEDVQFALKCSRLCTTPSNSSEVNIASCKILSLVHGLPFVAADLRSKLDEGIIRDILEDPSSCSVDKCDGKDCCIMEILDVLTNNLEMPQMLEIHTEYTALPTIAMHIACGILSGDDQIIKRSKKIISSIDFSKLESKGKVVGIFRYLRKLHLERK